MVDDGNHEPIALLLNRLHAEAHRRPNTICHTDI